jgi:23S rRNA pseudouridine1911/1915/1917 synthase
MSLRTPSQSREKPLKFVKINQYMNIKILAENLSKTERVDLYLLSQRPDVTRTSIKHVIMSGLVKVNGESIRPNYKIRNGDLVELDWEKADDLINAENLTRLKPSKLHVDLVYEDEDLIVVNKPDGIVVHPVYGHTEDTLMNALVNYILDKSDKVTGVRLRPVHRLDKDTSGVILFSKNLKAHEYYSRLFENHKIEKTYYAVVKGDFQKFIQQKSSEEYFEVFTYIGRSRFDDRKYANVDSRAGLPARTRIYFENFWEAPPTSRLRKSIYSLVKLIPETGRTHQLRVHLSGLNFPIVGDPIYSNIPFQRLMLHAFSLKLKNQKNEDVKFEAKLPSLFKD